MSKSLTGESTASSTQGTHLHPTVDSPSGPLQPGELTLAVCPAPTRVGSGLEAGGH